MKHFFYSLLLLLAMMACRTDKQDQQAKQSARDVAWLSHWLHSWMWMDSAVLKLPPAELPEMVFFDSTSVFTTSPVSAPNGVLMTDPSLAEYPFTFLTQSIQDSVILPNHEKVPIQLMSFAAPMPDNNHSFFIMAAPSFWDQSGVSSELVPMHHLLTGVFLHEFAHTRQMTGFGNRVTELERSNKFNFPVGDDIIQDYFQSDSMYTRLYHEEVDLLYQAVAQKDTSLRIVQALQGLRMIENRQRVLHKTHPALVEFDNLFLTMEGLGQYLIVRYLTSSVGGNFPEAVAIQAARRKRNHWSQDEGLALVLLYTRLETQPQWNKFFNEEPVSIVDFIRDAIERKVRTSR